MTGEGRGRLAIVVTSDLIGGHEMQLARVARTMGETRAVTLVATSRVAERYFRDQGLDVRLAPFSRPGKIWRQWQAGRALAAVLAPVVADDDAVMVSGGTVEACVAPARALKILRPDRPVTAYIPMYIDRAIAWGPVGSVYNRASRVFIGAIDVFITINRIQARLIAHHYRRPVRVIANTVTPLPTPVADHGPRLIVVGRLDDGQKNVSGAIDLLDHPGNPFAELHVFGDGPDRAAIEARGRAARHLAVAFHGWTSHDRLADALGRRDVLVMNSRWEGEPMIVRELAAAGIPAVVTNIPGFRGLVRRSRRYTDQRELLAILQGLHASMVSQDPGAPR
jgi:glycosyltransferase involved in cell wall biosynthesis